MLQADGSALIVVDMQNGFLELDSAMGRIGFDIPLLQRAIAPCQRVVAAARSAGVPIIWTRYVYASDYADGGIMVELVPGLKTERAVCSGDREVEIIDSLAPLPGEVVIDKNRPSAFFKTGLQDILEKAGIERVIVCGVTTNCCVESTVRDAAHLDIPTFVIFDAVAEADQSRHDHALQVMGLLFARMVSVADVEAAFGQLSQSPA